MNTVVLLPLQESMAKCSAGKHIHGRGYMTVLVVNHGSIKSISTLTTVIRPVIKYDVGNLRDCFRQKVNWTLDIRSQHLTLSELDLVHIHHLSHALLQEKDTYCLPEGNQ